MDEIGLQELFRDHHGMLFSQLGNTRNVMETIRYYTGYQYCPSKYINELQHHIWCKNFYCPSTCSHCLGLPHVCGVSK